MNWLPQYKIFVDVESTGFDAIRNDIVSLAAIVSDNDFNIKGEFYETVRPDFNKFYSDEAENIHGFRRTESEGFQDQRSFCIKLLNFLKPFKDLDNFPQMFVSHSLGQFDYKFTEWIFRKNSLQYSLWKVLRQDYQRSTIKEARMQGYKKNGLSVWADRVGFDLLHHNASSDIRCCYEVD